MGFGDIPEVFTTHTHVIDDTFGVGDSLIGGAQTILGIVMYAYVVDQIATDGYLDIDLFLDGIDTSTSGGPLDRDGDIIGFGAGRYEGNVQSGGWERDFFANGGELPQTSYNLKAAEAGAYKKTVKVVVLNSSLT